MAFLLSGQFGTVQDRLGQSRAELKCKCVKGQTRTDQNRPGQTRTAQDSQGKTRGLLKGSFFAPSKSDCVNFSLCNKERRNKIGGNDDCGGHMVMVMMSSTRVQSQNSRSALVVYNSSLP